MMQMQALLKPLRCVHQTYIRRSISHPYSTAMATGGSILTVSDYTAQQLAAWKVNGYQYDWRRTLAMGAFGTFYYGIAARKIYFLYEQLLGPGQVFRKSMIDCGLHGPFLMLPSFYFMTGVIKGQSLTEMRDQFKQEFLTSGSATILYWAPFMYMSFRFFTQHSRIFYITLVSFIHKSGLSWYANRHRMHQRILNK